MAEPEGTTSMMWYPILLAPLCGLLAHDEKVFSVPRGSEARVITLKGTELLRNGSFRYERSGWAFLGQLVGVSRQAQSPSSDSLGAFLNLPGFGEPSAILRQEVTAPTKLTKLLFRMNARVLAEPGQIPNLGMVALRLSRFDGQRLDLLREVPLHDRLSGEWNAVDVRIRKWTRERIERACARGERLVLELVVEGRGIQVHVDDLSLRADGTVAIPATTGVLGYTAHEEDALRVRVTNADGSVRGELLRGAVGTRCYGLDWRPDGKALALAATIEAGASPWASDLFELDAKGTRRITNPPGLNALGEGPRGDVRVTVRNHIEKDLTVFVLIQGAKHGTFVTLGPRGHASATKKVVVKGVQDLGPNRPQMVCVRYQNRTYVMPHGIDVVPGKEVVLAGELPVSRAMVTFQPSSPSYLPGGRKIAFSMGYLYAVDADGEGVPEKHFGSLMGMHVTVAPRTDRALYVSMDLGIWMIEKGAPAATQLVGALGMMTERPAWCPDGQGFVFALQTSGAHMNTFGSLQHFAIENRAMTTLCEFADEGIESPTLSPCGRYVAFVRILRGRKAQRRELWVQSRENPATRWRIETELEPALVSWGPEPVE